MTTKQLSIVSFSLNGRSLQVRFDGSQSFDPGGENIEETLAHDGVFFRKTPRAARLEIDLIVNEKTKIEDFRLEDASVVIKADTWQVWTLGQAVVQPQSVDLSSGTLSLLVIAERAVEIAGAA